MNEEQRKRWANDQKGWSYHSSICTCEKCEAVYQQHNRTHWCACDVCVNQTQNRQNPYRSDAKGETVMATVNFCDRCESMGKADAMGRLTYMTDITQLPKDVEICPGCVGDFMEWLESDIMTTRERGYRKPWKKEEKEPEKTGVIITNADDLKALMRELESGE